MRKAIRWLAWGLGGLTALAVVLYLFRWPIVGGRIRREIARVADEQLACEVSIGRLGGSLLFGLDAEGVELRPRPASPLASAAVRTVSVRYGFLGSSPFWIEATGASVALARKPGPPTPVRETIRDAVPIVRSLRFDGRVRVRESRLELADGRRFEISEASLEGDQIRGKFRTEDLGEVTVESARSDGGALSVRAEATEGPVRSASIDFGRLEGSAQTLQIRGSFKEQTLSWNGTLTGDAQGRPVRAQGRLAVPQGRAETDVDLAAGRARLDVDGTVPVREPVTADVSIRGRAEGPLEGPPEAWTFSEITATTRKAVAGGLAIDSAEAASPRGNLSSLPIRLAVTRGADHAEVEGVVHWKEALELELKGRAEAEDLAPYLRLLPDPPSLGASAPRVEGTLRLAGGMLSFDGAVQSGPGSFEGRTWDSIRIAGAVSSEGVVAREILVYGAEAAPVISGKGSVAGERIEADLEAGPDRASLRGRRARSGELEGELWIDGPCLWLRMVGVALPPWASPVHLKGKASFAEQTLRSSFVVSAGEGLAATPDLVARAKDGAWAVELAAGTVFLPGGTALRHEAMSIESRPGRIAVPDLRVSTDHPPFSARLAASVEEDGGTTRIAFDARELEALGLKIESLSARVDVDRESGEASVLARWGRDGLPSLLVSGRLGAESDLNVLMRLPDLADPFLRKVLPGIELQGAATVDVSVRGPLDRPEVTGTVSVQGLTTGGWQALGIVLPVRTENGILQIWCDDETPYGRLRVDGRTDLPWVAAKPRIDVTGTLVMEDPSPFLGRIDPGVKPWIPPGRLSLEGHLRGPVGSPLAWLEATFESAGYAPPAPLGKAADLRVEARLDDAGLQIGLVRGRLGGGFFQGKGLWEVWKENRPLAVHVTGDDLLVVDDNLARIRIKPDVTLHHTRDRGLWLDGFVEVPLVIYHREFGSPELGKPEGRGTAPLEARAPRLRLIPLPAGGFRIPGIEGLEALALDLGFRTTGEFRIENSAVGVHLGAEGRLRGSGAVPAASGKVRAKPRHGEIRVGPGAFVRIESAELLLPEEPGREGSIRFEGRMGSGQDQITILISGPPEHASLTLVSDPPKDQRELLAVLGQKAALGTLTSQLTPGMTDDWPKADRRESFLSRIAPTVIPGEAPGQRRNPWELPAVGTARGTVVRTEYLYNKFFSIIAETDREVDVSGDVKLRIRF